MFNFNNLKSVGKLADKQEEMRARSAEDSYNRAMGFIKKFNFEQNYNSNYLLEAARLLSQSVKFKKTNPEPYFYLSYIFYLMNKDDLSIKYLKIAQKIQPDMDGITKMQQLLSNTSDTYSASTIKKIENEFVNHEFNGEIKIVTSIGNQIEEAEFKKKGTGSLEFNNDTKTTTTLGKKIQRVTRLSQA
jgi:hypothetical protein